MRDTEASLFRRMVNMAHAILEYEQDMQQLERELAVLQRDVGTYLAVRRFPFLRWNVHMDEEERASEDIREMGKGREELVDLREWPLPPRRSEWVLREERMMEKSTQARR